MRGTSKNVAAQYNEAELAGLFGPEGHRGEVRVRYQRGASGDITSPLPSTRHLAYVAKGWTAVAVVEEPARAVEKPVVVPPAVANHAQHDRSAVWTRGDSTIIQSCKHAPKLLQSGWAFVRLTSCREMYLDSLHGRTPSRDEAAKAATLSDA